MVENRADQVNQNRQDSTRCRYKTGRCMNARVLKPNGTLLLLCEFHRNQQNRTKKRSDMKYRQDRAKKRLVGHHQSPDDATPASLSSTAIEMARAAPVKCEGASGGAASSSTINSKRSVSSNTESEFRPTKRAKPSAREHSKPLAAVIPQPIRLEHLAIIASSSNSTTTIEPSIQIRRVLEPLHSQKHRRHDSTDSSLPRSDSLAASDPINPSSSICLAGDLDEDATPCTFFPMQSCSSALDQRWPPNDVQLLEYFIL